VGPYLPLRRLPFLSDDYHAVAHASRGWESLRADLTGPQFGAGTIRFYRPVVSASLAANHALSGLDPEGYRWTNLAAHAGSVLLLRSIALGLGLPPGSALAAAAAFAVFPYGPGAVAWVIGRVDSFAAFFAFASLLLHLRARRSGRALSPGSLACAALALGSKEVAVTLPLLLLVFERLRPGGSLRSTLPAFGLLAAYLAVRRIAIGAWVGGYPIELSLRSAGEAALGAIEGMGRTLCAFPGVPASVAFLLGLVVIGVAFRVNPKVAAFGCATWLLFSLPAWATLRELQVRPNLRNFYLPNAGLALLLGCVSGWGVRAAGIPLFGGAFLAMGGGLLLSVNDHRAAGAQVAAIREGVSSEAARCESVPVFVSDVPRARGTAYLFNWGFGSAMEPPFRLEGPRVLLLRPLFAQVPTRESLVLAPAGRCHLEVRADGSVARVPQSRAIPRLAVSSAGFGPVLTVAALQAALDGPDIPIEFDPAPVGPVHATLFTSLGCNEAELPPAPVGLVQGLFRASFAPGLALAHTAVQAFDAGDRAFLLHFHAACADGERESDLLEVRFAEDVAVAFRGAHLR
jgi:hypothetical protein